MRAVDRNPLLGLPPRLPPAAPVKNDFRSWVLGVGGKITKNDQLLMCRAWVSVWVLGVGDGENHEK